MSFKYEEYLDKGTQTLLNLFSSDDFSAEEKELLTDRFISELEKNISNDELAESPEQMIYTVVVMNLDNKISKMISNSKLSCTELTLALNICKHQENNLTKFAENNWYLPGLVNQNIDNCRNIFILRQEICSISSKILDEDKRISQLMIRAEKDLNVKDCETLFSLLSELKEDLKNCKNKKIHFPSIDNINTKKVTIHVEKIRKIALQKEELHKKMYDIDHQLDQLISMSKTTLIQWDEIINTCRRQKSLINNCSKKQWPLPSIKYTKLSDMERMYQHYKKLQESDDYLGNNRDNLKSRKRYREYLDVCSNQCNNIKFCRDNNWSLPEIKFKDPGELSRIILREKKKKEDAAKVKRTLILITLGVVAILTLVILCTVKYREGKVQIPFDNSYAAEKNLDDIYDELNSAGFVNIIMQKDDSGWLESGQVLSVTIDNNDIYKKKKYIKPDVSVIIKYSSDNRIYITDLLEGWNNTDYEILVEKLRKAGFTNITAESIDSFDSNDNGIVSTLDLNGKNYINEHCYLSANAPITITYNAFKVRIGNNRAEFIGQNYEDVAARLKESGFTNVSTEKIMTGWAKENTVVGVNINNSDLYDKNSAFNPNEKIVIKYSSSNRVDITSILSNWKTSKYVDIGAKLSNKNYTDVTYKEIITNDKSENQLISAIYINDEKFVQGDCFVQKSAPIVIEYYNLKIIIGKEASDFKENEEGEYQRVVEKLENMGFSNIRLLRNNGLINGWITEEGSIDSISIDGNSDFSDEDSFYYDDPIVIVVNTFSDKGCDDITEIAH